MKGEIMFPEKKEKVVVDGKAYIKAIFTDEVLMYKILIEEVN